MVQLERQVIAGSVAMDSAATFAGEQPMARPLGLVFAFGALLVGLWDLLPELGSPHRLMIGLLAAGALLFGMVLLSGRLDWLPLPALEAIVAGATLGVSLVLYLGGPTSGFALGYLFVTPYAFWFFPRWRALAQVAFVGLCFAGTLLVFHVANDSPLGSWTDYLGRVVLLVGAVLVVGELVAMLGRGLRRRDERFARVFMGSPLGIVRAGLDGRMLEVNPAFCEIVGRPATELVGQTPDRLFSFAEGEDLATSVADRIAAGEYPTMVVEREYSRPDGSTRTVEVAVTTVRSADGSPPEMWAQVLDVTERRQHEEQLRYLADHDPLTGLLNRRRFEYELARELGRVRPEASRGAVISVDLDGFKSINDSAGHEVGDSVLRSVAGALDASLRGQDILARHGGDEFVALLPETSPAQAGRVAERILHSLHSLEFEIGGAPFRLTASVGVAWFDAEPTHPGELMVNADLAMYAAKTSGRDRAMVFGPADAKQARSLARVSWGPRIQAALGDGLFELHSQPIVELSTGRVSHVELLLRLRERDGLILPGEFLVAAERLGLIHAIDRWVIEQALGMLAAGPPGEVLPVALNLSAASVVGDAGLLDLIERRLSEVTVDPELLIFEITETASIASMPEAEAFAAGIHAMGCRLALDDFGSGFASFYHVKHLPIDFLKIDGEFISNLARSELDQKLVTSMVNLSRTLGVHTVAEMVEDEPTATCVRDLGIEYGQGYHFGRPGPPQADA